MNVNKAEMGTQDYMRALAQKLDAASHGERGRLVREAADFLSFSTTEVYRRLHAIGWKSGRKPRTDRGGSQLADAELSTVASLMLESTRANGKRLLSCEAALEIATANGMVRDLGVTPAHVLRLLKARNLHPDQVNQPAPHVSMATPHPNHTWQIDASVCVLYYLSTKGLQVMREREFYKNKPQNFKRVERDRVIRYVVTDHYSGACYVEYFLGAEDSVKLIDFFLNAIERRASPQDPFHGVPLQLMDDAGSANTSHLFDNLLTRLQVKHLTHMPGNPRAKGQVEGMQNIIERDFEGRLGIGRKVQTLAELNLLAHQWMRWFNGTKIHSRHGHTRYALWQTIREEELRIAPPRDLTRELLRTKPTWATVSRNLTVQYAPPGSRSQTYRVAHLALSVGDKVEVCVNPYAAPAVNVITYAADGTEILNVVEPVAKNAAGFELTAPVVGESFAAQPDTAVDTNRKAMLKTAYGADTLEEAQKKKTSRAPAFEGMDAFAHLEPSADYMQRRGTTLPIERPRSEAAPLTHARAAKSLVARGVVMNKSRYVRMVEMFPAGVREAELDRLAAIFGGSSTDAGEAVEQVPKVARIK